MYQLDVECFEPAFRFTRADMRESLLVPQAVALVEEDSYGLAGFCIAHVGERRSQRTAYLLTIDVAERVRGRGLGHELLAAVETGVHAEGAEALVLHVYVGNDAAIALYERAGYERLACVPEFYLGNRDAWLYRKELREATDACSGALSRV